jgi:hypothetical protein
MSTLFVGQTRMFTRTQGRTRMQRDLRTGLALLPLDLRGAARQSVTVADLVDLQDSLIQIRATIGSSVVCARPATNQVDLPPTGTVRNTLTAWYTQPLPGDTVLLYDDGPLPDPQDDTWVPRAITAVANGFSPAAGAAAATCPGLPFTDPSSDAAKPRWRVTFSGVADTTVRVGAPVRFLRSARYSLFQPAAGAQWYLGYRELLSNAWGTAQPIAGPFAAPGTGAGIRFSYFDTTGAALPAVPSAAQRTLVGRVDLVLRTRVILRASAGADSAVVRDSIATRIALRNRL